MSKAKQVGVGINKLYLSQVIWVKLSTFPWWPAVVVDEGNCHERVLRHKTPRKFVFKYIGHPDYGWTHNDANSVRPFRHPAFHAMAKHKQIVKIIDQAQHIEERLKAKRGDNWDQQPDEPDADHLLVPCTQPGWEESDCYDSDDDDDDDDDDDEADSDESPPPPPPPPKKKPAAKKAADGQSSKRARASTAAASAQVVKKARRRDDGRAEKLQRKKERAMLRVEVAKAAPAPDEITDTSVEELDSIALDLIAQFRNHNGATLMRLFAGLKRLRVNKDLLRDSKVGKKIKLLARTEHKIDPLYDQAIHDIASEIYNQWVAIATTSTISSSSIESNQSTSIESTSTESTLSQHQLNQH